MLKKVFAFLALFSSLGTLFCCALPVLFVTLLLGSTLVSVLNVFPQLIWLSEHTVEVFVFAGVMLSATTLLRAYARTKSCPFDE